MSAPTLEEQVEEFAADIGAQAPYQDRPTLQKMPLFNTPDSVEALQEYIASLTNADERIVAITVMGLTWNICAEIMSD